MSGGAKTDATEQFARVSEDGLANSPSDQTPAAGANFGKSLLVDEFGRLIVKVQNAGMTSGTPNVFVNLDASAGLPALIAGSPTTLLNIYGFAPDVAWLMLFDKASVPIASDVPHICLKVLKEDFAIYNVQVTGDPFSLGLGVAWSSDPFVLTLPPKAPEDSYRTRVLWRAGI